MTSVPSLFLSSSFHLFIIVVLAPHLGSHSTPLVQSEPITQQHTLDSLGTPQFRTTTKPVYPTSTLHNKQHFNTRPGR